MRAIASDDIISTKLISTNLVNIIIKLISQLPITFKLPGKGTIYVTGTSTHHTHTSSCYSDPTPALLQPNSTNPTCTQSHPNPSHRVHPPSSIFVRNYSPMTQRLQLPLRG